MKEVFSKIWAIRQDYGMFPDPVTVIILIISLMVVLFIMWYLGHQADKELRRNMIKDMGFDGYLAHKERMDKIGIHVP